MSNDKIYKLGMNAQLRELTEASILVAATQISGEDPSNPENPLTPVRAAKRHSLATSVCNGSQAMAMKFAKCVAAQSGFYSVVDINQDGTLNYTGGGSLDGDLDFTVNSVWDDIAGVSFDDKIV